MELVSWISLVVIVSCIVNVLFFNGDDGDEQ